MSDNSAKWPADSFGIYLILDKASGRINVGATSRSFQARWRDHRCDLRAGRHANGILQRSFKRDGEGAFVMMRVEVLSVRDPSLIASRENYWIRELQSRVENGGFNLKDGEAMTVMSNVTRDLMRRIAYERRGHQFRFRTPDGTIVDAPDLPSFCAERGLNPRMMAEVFSGRRRSHGGYVRFDSDYTPRGYRTVTLISPAGERHTTANLTQFAKDRGLCSSSLIALSHGEYSQHKGWTVEEVVKTPETRVRRSGRPHPSREYDFRSPNGDQVHVADLTSFCKERGLDRQCMVGVWNGAKVSHRGYTRVGSSWTPKQCRTYTITDPSGKTYQTSSLLQFAREHGVSAAGLSQVHTGRLKTTSGGWRVKQ